MNSTKRFGIRLSSVANIFLVFMAAFGCGSNSSAAADAAPDAPSADAVPDAPPPCFPLDGPSEVDGSPVSFSGRVLPLLQICAAFECHGSLAGGLDLRPGQQYSSLVGRAAGECADGRLYVDPGHSDRSYFLDKLRGSICHCQGERMPLGGPYLAPDDLAAIREWIDDGAPNN
jgi:hypothetical protein